MTVCAAIQPSLLDAASRSGCSSADLIELYHASRDGFDWKCAFPIFLEHLCRPEPNTVSLEMVYAREDPARRAAVSISPILEALAVMHDRDSSEWALLVASMPQVWVFGRIGVCTLSPGILSCLLLRPRK
jgi:hypothetical protein